MRLAASTLPGAHAYINDAEVKVYSSGAFIGLVPIAVGPNTIKFVVRSSAGDSLVQYFTIIRPEELKSSPRDVITIDSVMMRPNQDLWLKSGDVLEVKMKGTPGQEPVFDIEGVESGVPMRELGTKDTGGLEGIYVGRYTIQSRDECRSTPVRFRVKKNFFSSEKKFSRGKITIVRDSLPRVAEVVGRRPYLNIGLGNDRLGGAKLGFLVPGIHVIITGMVDDQFRVRLSDDMEAWLPQEYVQFLPVETPRPSALTGSISVFGTETEDVVSISIGQKLPFISEQRINPASIVVHIFGAHSNTNWITHQLSAQEIQQVSCSQVGADDYQLTISLKSAQHWGYDIGYEGNAMKIKVRRPPVIADPAAPLSKLTIALDAGHGGDNHGAFGSTGVLEKDINLALVGKLDSILQIKGVRTVVTRTSDTEVSSNERINIILSAHPHLFVSVHCNSISASTDAELVKGISTYYRYPGFKPLADILYAHLLSIGLAEWGVTGNFNFSLNGFTQMPNALVETAFMSNPEDEIKLLDDDFRKQVALQIAAGLEEYMRTYGKK